MEKPLLRVSQLHFKKLSVVVLFLRIEKTFREASITEHLYSTASVLACDT